MGSLGSWTRRKLSCSDGIKREKKKLTQKNSFIVKADEHKSASLKRVESFSFLHLLQLYVQFLSTYCFYAMTTLPFNYALNTTFSYGIYMNPGQMKKTFSKITYKPYYYYDVQYYKFTKVLNIIIIILRKKY